MKYFLLLALAFTACTHPTSTEHTDTNPWLLVEDPDTGQTGYRDDNGETVIPTGKYAMCLTDTFRTHAVVLLHNDGKWVVIDRQENVLYEVFPYDNGPDYPSEGLFRIVQNGKIGYADADTYAVVIEPQFDCAYPFENGKAKVSQQCQTIKDGEHSVWESDTWQYIDKEGKISAY
ncbi:MAG TPA: WG repeat-containing protein [Saprospiraceae bacterium]|nr:WG repeat-containing protein [Saprospiraceae bacterium]HMQ82925.1 WG repeat-containing protein [Saprospiraceae bacterium]